MFKKTSTACRRIPSSIQVQGLVDLVSCRVYTILSCHCAVMSQLFMPGHVSMS